MGKKHKKNREEKNQDRVIVRNLMKPGDARAVLRLFRDWSCEMLEKGKKGIEEETLLSVIDALTTADMALVMMEKARERAEE